MGNRAVDIRLTIQASSEEDSDIPEILEKLKSITGTKKETELLKMCVRISYEKYWKNFEHFPGDLSDSIKNLNKK